MTKEESDFAKAMRAQGVKPLARPVSLPPAAKKPGPDKHTRAALPLRRQRATEETRSAAMPLGDSVSEWLGPQDRIEFCRPGLQQRQFQQLKQGKIRPQATLDLHRCKVEEARRLLIQFVKDCQREGVRCALVMHGKGYHTRQTEESPATPPPSRIKSFAIHWLKQMTEVLAMASAQPRDGGSGVVYVLFTSRGEAGKLPPSF